MLYSQLRNDNNHLPVNVDFIPFMFRVCICSSDITSSMNFQIVQGKSKKNMFSLVQQKKNNQISSNINISIIKELLVE